MATKESKDYDGERAAVAKQRQVPGFGSSKCPRSRTSITGNDPTLNFPAARKKNIGALPRTATICSPDQI